MAYHILDLLRKAYEEKASDLHLTVGSRPILRVHGQLRAFGTETLTPFDTEEMARRLVPDDRWETFLTEREMDLNFQLDDACRFRINVFHQQNYISLAIRMIPTKIPTLEQLNMPPVIEKLLVKPQGLILVTGPTGSGKSTTLAAMIDYINGRFAKHIITLEDPIEYVHEHKRSIINQREVGKDTKNFASGLRAALRQDPDVILVGEMRDLETIATAVTAAETGHLVLATLHTVSAAQTIDRIIDVFPPHQQGQIRLQLASVLQGVISQRLLPKRGLDGRIAATEILVNYPSVANLIRNGKTHQIPNILQTGKALGMHTLEMSVQSLLSKGEISEETAKVYIGAGE